MEMARSVLSRIHTATKGASRARQAEKALAAAVFGTGIRGFYERGLFFSGSNLCNWSSEQ